MCHASFYNKAFLGFIKNFFITALKYRITKVYQITLVGSCSTLTTDPNTSTSLLSPQYICNMHVYPETQKP